MTHTFDAPVASALPAWVLAYCRGGVRPARLLSLCMNGRFMLEPRDLPLLVPEAQTLLDWAQENPPPVLPDPAWENLIVVLKAEPIWKAWETSYLARLHREALDSADPYLPVDSQIQREYTASLDHYFSLYRGGKLQQYSPVLSRAIQYPTAAGLWECRNELERVQWALWTLQQAKKREGRVAFRFWEQSYHSLHPRYEWHEIHAVFCLQKYLKGTIWETAKHAEWGQP